MERENAQAAAGDERRKHPRLNVTALGVAITVRAALSGEQFTASLDDVSVGGCSRSSRAESAVAITTGIRRRRSDRVPSAR